MYNKYQLQYFKSRTRFIAALIFFAALFLHHIHFQTINTLALFILFCVLSLVMFYHWKKMDFYLDCWIEDVMPNSSVHTFGEKHIDREWSKYQAKKKR